MAAAKPVVLAIDGVIREVVEKAQCGIFCEPGNPTEISKAINFLYNNQAEAEKMGINGRSYLEKHFDRKEIAEKLCKLIKEMIKNGRKDINC